MNFFHIKRIHKLWLLCLCLSIIPAGLTYAGNKYTVTKIKNQALTTTAAGTLSQVANGDTLVITGDSLDVAPNPVNDWWLLANTPFSPLPGKNFVLVLETDNKRVPEWLLGYMSMTSIIFPNIEFIGKGAFQYCANLTSAYLPNVQIIDTTAFHYCGNLTEVYLPNAEHIKKGAFQFDTNLEITSLPKVISLGEEAFG